MTGPGGELVQRIGGLLLDAAPGDFRRIDVRVSQTVAAQDLRLAVYRADASTVEVLPPDALYAAFTDLRRACALPGRGTWFSVRCVVNAPGRIDLLYDYDHEPAWIVPVPAEDYARDLAAFPRDAAHVPGWLRPAGPGPAPPLDEAGLRRALGSLTTLVVHQLPGHWQEAGIELRALGTHSRTSARLRDFTGRPLDWEPPASVTRELMRLRTGMCRPGRGTWFTIRCRIEHPDRHTATYDWQDEPAFTPGPARRHYVEELALHPRAAGAVPAWLSAGAGEPPVCAADLDEARGADTT